MISSTLVFVRRRILELALVASALSLGWMSYSRTSASGQHELRNADFTSTYISLIHLDLTSPNHSVTLTWAGPKAESQETGPFRSSPGTGWGTNNCDDNVESNCLDSRCTP